MVMFSRIGQMSPAGCQSLGGSNAWMSRSDVDVPNVAFVFAVAPRRLDRVFGLVSKAVPAKTEAKQQGGRSQHSRPRCFAPQTSSRTCKAAATPPSPPVLEQCQRGVRGQCLSQRFARLVSKAVIEKTEEKQHNKGEEVSTADPDVFPPNKQQNTSNSSSNPGISPRTRGSRIRTPRSTA